MGCGSVLVSCYLGTPSLEPVSVNGSKSDNTIEADCCSDSSCNTSSLL